MIHHLYSALGETRLQKLLTAGLLAFIASFMLLPTSKMVNNVFYALMALPALFALIGGHCRKLEISRVFWLWGLLMLWLIYVGIESGDAQFFKHILYVCLFMLAVGQLIAPKIFLDSDFTRSLFWSVLIYIGGSSIYYWIIGEYAFGEKVLWLPGRMTGPIYSSIWLSCCFALNLPSWIRQGAWKELIAGLLFTLFIAAFALQSRSGLVGLFVLSFMAIIYLASTHPQTRRFLSVGGLLMAGCALWAYSEIPQIHALVARGDSARFEIWAALMNEWRDCGLMQGCGMEHKSDVILTGGGGILHPHSIYLSLGVFAGLPALLTFCLLMSLTMYIAWKNRNPWGLYLLSGMIGLAFDGSFLVGNPDELWLLILLPAALIIHPGSRTPQTHTNT